jgi:hypothetical protein
MDDAQKFIIDVGYADVGYLKGLAEYPNITIGSIQGLDYFQAPEFVRDIISFVSRDIFYPLLERIIYEKMPVTLRMIEEMDNVKCINDEIVFDLKEYLTNAEVPFALDVIRKTPLKDYTHLPDNIDKRLKQLADIPLCQEYSNLFQIPKLIFG